MYEVNLYPLYFTIIDCFLINYDVESKYFMKGVEFWLLAGNLVQPHKHFRVCGHYFYLHSREVERDGLNFVVLKLYCVTNK